MNNAIHSLAGALSLALILGAALFAIYSPRIKDGLIGRILYMTIAIVSMAGLMHIWDNTLPKHIITLLLSCVAILMLRDVVREHYWAGFQSRWVIFTKAEKARSKLR